nr:MAG TPA: hypothetical protein [Caudoviricetes sp.]
MPGTMTANLFYFFLLPLIATPCGRGVPLPFQPQRRDSGGFSSRHFIQRRTSDSTYPQVEPVRAAGCRSPFSRALFTVGTVTPAIAATSEFVRYTVNSYPSFFFDIVLSFLLRVLT